VTRFDAVLSGLADTQFPQHADAELRQLEMLLRTIPLAAPYDPRKSPR